MTEISIIIPTYNRAGRLKMCLEALARQTLPATDFEVIVVVDGSTDGSVDMMASLSLPYTLTALHQENSGQQTALNHGVTHAQSPICLFLDDDIIASPQLVSEHLSLHRRHDDVVGIGQMSLDMIHTDWYSKRYAKGWQEHYEELNQGLRQADWTDAYGGNLSMSRAVYLEIGGNDPEIKRSYDIELAYRIDNRGHKFVYLPDAVGRQEEYKTSRDLLRDARRYGAAWVMMCKRHPGMLPYFLGPLGDTSVRESLLRETLWRLRISPWLLSKLSSFLSHTKAGIKWYRFLYSYSYWCGVRDAIPDRNTWEQMVRGIPILMYHAFGRPGERSNQFVLPIRQFSRQLSWLKRLNYSILTLDQYIEYRCQYKLPPPRSIVLTIDDGFAEIASLVYPILLREKISATLFLVSGKIGSSYTWDDDIKLRNRKLLTWEEIEAMDTEIIQLGAHSCNHPILTEIPVDVAAIEIAKSKAELEKRMQKPVSTFAYPHGEFNEVLQDLVEQSGYKGACGVESNLNTWSTPLTALRRFEVEGTWSILRFLMILWLGGRL
jgi:glycosyltransferase involved in cell wall biosynthesis